MVIEDNRTNTFTFRVDDKNKEILEYISEQIGEDVEEVSSDIFLFALEEIQRRGWMDDKGTLNPQTLQELEQMEWNR